HYSAASAIRDMLATYRDAEDLINIGAYVAGSNPRVDLALSKMEGIRHFLRQGIYETSGFEQTMHQLLSVA
ncbi:MAG: EscN/YscN/HrcN family type III secretion system ATPase, partial [Candidatus Eremiobacteraeota bacterium]|nr:EscN/YscN/HrcN family type III secretion system ATPase [Candidatus Eremiobacteraeota bacterium]